MESDENNLEKSQNDVNILISNVEKINLCGDTPTASGSGDTPIPSGSGDMPIPSGSGDMPILSGSGDMPILSGSGDMPIPSGIDDMPTASGIDDTPIPSDSDQNSNITLESDQPTEGSDGSDESEGSDESAAENELINGEQASISDSLIHTAPSVIFDWELDGINFKINNSSKESSPSFYTGNPGFRIKIFVHFNVERYYLSVRFKVLQGIHDDDLDWPFNHNVSISLMNQQTGIAHIKRIRNRDELTNLFRPTPISRPYGFHNFIKLDKLREDINGQQVLVVNDKLKMKFFVYL